jgi:biotin operon repressor
MRYEVRQYLKIKAYMRSQLGYRPLFAAVFDELAGLLGSRGYSFVRQATIAERLGKSRQAVNVAVQWLRSAGVLMTVQTHMMLQGRRVMGALKYWFAWEPENCGAIMRWWERYRAQRRAKRQAKLAARAELERAKARVSGCQADATATATTELTLQVLLQETGQLASPALQRLMKEARFRG